MDSNQTVASGYCHPDVYTYRYFGATLGIVVTLVGTVGNVMTLLAFATDPRLRSRFNFLILNLTVSDLLYCAFLQPATVDTFIHFTWRGSAFACRLFGLVLFVANAVSIFNLILIAVGRYILITDSRRFDRLSSNRVLPFILALPWALGLALFGPLWNIYVFLPAVCTCSFHRSRGRPYTTILMFFMFGFGLSCIGIFYYLIYRKVHSVSQALEEHRREDRVRPKVQRAQPHGAASSDSGLAVDEEDPSRSQVTEGTSVAAWEGPSEPGTVSQSTAPTPTPDPPSVSAGGGEKEKGAVSSSKRNGSREFQRVTRMCFAMFLIYVACYFPFCIMHVADGKKRAPILLHMIAGNCTWLNSCLNPLLYTVMNRQFQTAYLGVLRRAAGLFTRCFCSGRS
ncbi:G-protein coupled receptor 84-like [Hypanus sabinus]|uniref:G-protein coupled receptor 84-like n=1 Tax=Hypanus sabinus TaxID=79690 RepID=UPI0028C40C00|nr:G-protein coupled receptor 84-like [Hypanus sabinus]